IWVEADSQKAIVIGRGGHMIKAIGMAARRELERELGGRVHLALQVRVRRRWRADDELLDRLARLLADVHAVEPGPARPRDYQSWAWPEKRVVPAWATRPGLWEDAFAVLAEEPPPYDAAFLHRDFHLGNVLWHDGEVTGLVDWVETSWGPAALDVAHARTYLAMLHGGDAADRFGQAYDALRPGARTGARYWDVLDVVGYLPDPAKVVQPWRDQGLAIVDGTARIRLEEHLAAVLDG
ncbi:MAG: phosphotransferase, partial [Nocardioides sp.]